MVMGNEVPSIFGRFKKMVRIRLVLPRVGVALQLLLDNPMTTLLLGVQPNLV